MTHQNPNQPPGPTPDTPLPGNPPPVYAGPTRERFEPTQPASMTGSSVDTPGDDEEEDEEE